MKWKTIIIALGICALGLLLSLLLRMVIPGFIPIFIFLPFIFFTRRKNNDDQPIN